MAAIPPPLPNPVTTPVPGARVPGMGCALHSAATHTPITTTRATSHDRDDDQDGGAMMTMLLLTSSTYFLLLQQANKATLKTMLVNIMYPKQLALCAHHPATIARLPHARLSATSLHQRLSKCHCKQPEPEPAGAFGCFARAGRPAGKPTNYKYLLP